eukprot:10486155-Alexandrium_andersonii.AAC.1
MHACSGTYQGYTRLQCTSGFSRIAPIVKQNCLLKPRWQGTQACGYSHELEQPGGRRHLSSCGRC